MSRSPHIYSKQSWKLISLQGSVLDSHFKIEQRFTVLQKEILVSQVLNKHIATPYLLRLFPLEAFWQ